MSAPDRGQCWTIPICKYHGLTTVLKFYSLGKWVDGCGECRGVEVEWIDVVPKKDSGEPSDPTLEDGCHLALWTEFHGLTRAHGDRAGELAHKLAVLAFRFYADEDEGENDG